MFDLEVCNLEFSKSLKLLHEVQDSKVYWCASLRQMDGIWKEEHVLNHHWVLKEKSKIKHYDFYYSAFTVKEISEKIINNWVMHKVNLDFICSVNQPRYHEERSNTMLDSLAKMRMFELVSMGDSRYRKSVF